MSAKHEEFHHNYIRAMRRVAGGDARGPNAILPTPRYYEPLELSINPLPIV